MRTVLGDHTRYKTTYFSAYPGYYFTGDGCRRDEDGYYWITGRVDDMVFLSFIMKIIVYFYSFNLDQCFRTFVVDGRD